MKTYITSLLLLLALTSCAQKNTTSDNQTITWGGKAAVGSYAPEGTLTIKNITSMVRDSTIQNLQITIDMKSLTQENKRLTKHLRDKDFFHVKKYPEAIFELTTPFAIATDSLLLGKMTIKNKTQMEIIPATVIVKDGALEIAFDHTMNRLNYGVTYNSPSVFEKIKENAIADEITLKGKVQILLQ